MRASVACFAACTVDYVGDCPYVVFARIRTSVNDSAADRSYGVQQVLSPCNPKCFVDAIGCLDHAQWTTAILRHLWGIGDKSRLSLKRADGVFPNLDNYEWVF